ncbi:anticodon-binding protein [Sphaerisporangium album]|uniref:Anticodon-binding protein n=1 Tax=Sphaerisporangium album TaxID=509200 RepID=A0A367FLE6_9ACTN|nr:anticodon-binding protein [Sphaerisporangium album]
MTVDALRAILGSPPVPEGSWEREAVYVSAAALRRAGPARQVAEAPAGGPARKIAERPAGGSAREIAEGLAVRLRAVPGVRAVQVRPNGFLVIEVAVPGEVVREILAEPVTPAEVPVPAGAAPWPEAPLTWSNPGFVVRYAYVRAGAVQRWARDLGIEAGPQGVSGQGKGGPEERRGEPEAGAGFRPESLDDPRDRAVLRVLAELPSRRAGRDAGRSGRYLSCGGGSRASGGGAPGREPGWPAYLERLAESYHDAFEHAPASPKGDEPPTGTHVARLWMARAVRRVLGEGLTALGQAPPVKI